MNTDFQEFPKLSRLSREAIITEKLDGTNACVFITEGAADTPKAIAAWFDTETSTDMLMFAGSRTRWITPQDDNFGFAKWVADHVEELKGLGTGRHFGEWWGSGIQRGYNLPKGEKRWSLFNTVRWVRHDQLPDEGQKRLPACCHLVPVLYHGMFSTHVVDAMIVQLMERGSHAAPGFMRPEGVVVFHTAANMAFKKTLEKDEVPKTLQKH